MHLRLGKRNKVLAVLILSSSFFVIELVFGFKNRSLALVADAFHVLTDNLSYVVALVAINMEEGSSAPNHYSFGYQRATLLGSFFNGVFLLALGFSISLQSIERFVELQEVRDPKTVLIVGGIGLAINFISMTFVHEHHGHGHGHGHDAVDKTQQDAEEVPVPPTSIQDHHANHHHSKVTKVFKKDRDFGMLGVLLHLIGDAINNIGVMLSAIIIWKTKSHSRYYADPAISLFIALSIIFTSLPLIMRSGRILLDSAPKELDLEGVEKDITNIPGILDAHDLHVWSLTQQKRIASVHIATDEDSIQKFMLSAQKVRDCLHHWSIHSLTIQPEYVHPAHLTQESLDPTIARTSFTVLATSLDTDEELEDGGLKRRRCQLRCPPSSSCENLVCCP